MLEFGVNAVNCRSFGTAGKQLSNEGLVARGPIALDYLSWNAAARIDLNAVGLSPLPDRLGVCLGG